MRGSQPILYVDDDPSILSLAQRMLQRLGYAVEPFTAPAAAIAAFRQAPDRFLAVVTDMNMPELSGLQLASQVLAVRPGVPVILTSGCITEEISAAAREAGVKEVVYKPNTIQELSALIHSALAAGSPPSDK
jgi:DNA-binding NtrC family response regulator